MSKQGYELQASTTKQMYLLKWMLICTSAMHCYSSLDCRIINIEQRVPRKFLKCTGLLLSVSCTQPIALCLEAFQTTHTLT